MINGIPATTQHNNYYMTERTHVSRHPCCGDDDGDTDTFDMQNTYGVSLPGIFPTTLPEVKKPYSSVSVHNFIMVRLVRIGGGEGGVI